jgi:hypothetical protein
MAVLAPLTIALAVRGDASPHESGTKPRTLHCAAATAAADGGQPARNGNCSTPRQCTTRATNTWEHSSRPPGRPRPKDLATHSGRVESPVHRNVHAGSGETDWSKDRHRARADLTTDRADAAEMKILRFPGQTTGRPLHPPLDQEDPRTAGRRSGASGIDGRFPICSHRLACRAWKDYVDLCRARPI